MNGRMGDLDARAAAWDVQPVLAALAEGDATTPPEHLRAAVMQRVGASPRRHATPATPVELYAARVQALRDLLARLGTADWLERARPYDWSVHGLVAHLLVIERYTAAQFGLGAAPAGNTGDHLALGADIIDAELGGSPTETARRWSDVAQSIIDHVQSGHFEPDAPAPLHGWPFSVSSALVARGFELWTHTDDIATATGRRVDPTAAGELRTMSSFSISTLPLLLPSVAPELTMAPTRVVLTGQGGATFDIGGDGERRALLATDVVDYCRVVARRLEPADLEATIEGDAALIGGLLEAARVFAV